MISHSVPLVKFQTCLINLSHVVYTKVWKENGYDHRHYPKTTYKFAIYFTNEIKNLTWSYDTQQEADAAQDRFLSLSEVFMMAELP